MQNLSDELAEILRDLRSGHEVLPFLERLFESQTMSLKLLPGDMQSVLDSSVDWREPVPGESPAWLQLESESGNAELIVYRARADGMIYVMAPTIS